MLLILEIALTLWACSRLKKADKSWALGLIPLGVAIVFGFFLGMVLGSAGSSPSEAALIGIFLDLGAMISLVWIGIANKPAKQQPLPPPPASLS